MRIDIQAICINNEMYGFAVMPMIMVMPMLKTAYGSVRL